MTREFPTRWRAVCANGLFALVFVLTLALPLATYWRGEPVDVATMSVGGLFAGQAVLASFLALWFVLRGPTSGRVFFTVPTGRWMARIAEGLRIGVRGWLLTMGAVLGVGVLLRGEIAPHPGFAPLVLWMARSPIALRLAVVATAMIVEEAFFRGFVQSRLGIVIATLWFALAHMNYGSPMMGIGVFVIGAVLGRTYQRTGDLAICAVAHGTFDAIQLLIVLPLIASQIPR